MAFHKAFCKVILKVEKFRFPKMTKLHIQRNVYCEENVCVALFSYALMSLAHIMENIIREYLLFIKLTNIASFDKFCRKTIKRCYFTVD